METIIDKILSEKVISRSSNLASSEIIDNIIKDIIKTYENISLRFNEKISTDEKIDSYLYWKENCLSVTETDIKTDNYSFKHYACCFLDELMPIYLSYIFYENKLYDITNRHQ